MEKLKKLLYPHPALVCLLAACGGGGLVWIFLTGRETQWVAYPIYVLSAYGLTVLCLWLVPLLIRLGRACRNRERTEEELARNFHRSLIMGLVMNLAYGGFQLVMPWITGSYWDGSQGAYQIIMALIHLVLLGYEKKMAKAAPEDARKIGWQGFRATGICLLILHLTMTGVVFQAIWAGETENYPGVLIFAVAAYTFYKVTMAIIRVVQYRKNTSPLWGAAKNVDLCEAQMNLYTLQGALLSVFGTEDQADFRFLMNTLVGGVVCILTVGGAIGMIRHGQKRKNDCGGNQNGTGDL